MVQLFRSAAMCFWHEHREMRNVTWCNILDLSIFTVIILDTKHRGDLYSVECIQALIPFYPAVTSPALCFYKPNTVALADKHTDFRGTGSNSGSVVLVALFKDGFQRDQAEWPFCLIVHFLQCDGGRQDIFSSGSLWHYFCFIDFPIPNSQFVPLTLSEGERKGWLCVFVCVCLCVC